MSAGSATIRLLHTEIAAEATQAGWQTVTPEQAAAVESLTACLIPADDTSGTHVSRVIHDCYELDPELGLQGGGGIDTRWHLSHRVRHLGHVTRGLQWGREWKRQLRQGFNRSRYALSHTTRLPLEGNRITLDPELNHAWRLPALQLTYALGPRDLALYQFFEDRANDLLVAAARKAWRLFPLDAPPLPANHLLGTCRMGNEPGKSVTDKFHRAHDVPDLLLVSGTSFVTSGRG